MDFNNVLPVTMFVDMNACFASIEQQANPMLRGKPVAVAAYATDYGCILASSYEAKALGIKTGMRVREGRSLCPGLVVLAPDPAKYRFVHKKMHRLFLEFTNDVVPKSIDEFALNFKDYPSFQEKSMQEIALEIKERIKKEIGEYIKVSVGIAPNRYLAKIASSYRKPDGLTEINKDNYLEIYKSLKLTDLCGIKEHNAARLASVGINSVLDFYRADIQKLKAGFRSVNGYYWYLRLHGYEVDDFISQRRSFGNSYALPKPYSRSEELAPILTKLTEKMAFRVRRKGYVAEGIHLAIFFRDGRFWHKGKKLVYPIFATRDFCREIFRVFGECKDLKPVRNLAVGCFNLKKKNFLQLDLALENIKKENLTLAMDFINNKYGDFTLTSARMAYMEDKVIDRIAFGIIS